MKNEIDRNSEEYHRIEHYEDYEFTNAVAYNMTRRNSSIQKTLLSYFKLNPHDEYNSTENINELAIIEEKLLNEFFIGYTTLRSLRVYNIQINKKLYGFVDTSDIAPHCLVDYSRNTSGVYEQNNKPTMATRELFPKFSEPKLTIPQNQDKSIEVNINFSLPKKEILAYISTLKDNYDTDTTRIKTPIEEENIMTYKEYANLINDFKSTKTLNPEDFTKKTIINQNNLKFTKSKQAIKYADAFYIYDYLTANKKFSKDDLYGDLEINLTDYHLGNPTQNYIKKTQIRKYYKYMIYMIEELGYKNLLTGNKLF